MTELVGGKRSALVVANYEYRDSKLKKLRAPAQDAKALAKVLGDPSIGDFEVGIVMNESEARIRRELARFFADRSLDDLLLLHLSCHGVKDEDGSLYFAMADTEVGNLDATAVPAEFLNRQMTKSRSRRIILLLDCCFSGAFASGMVARADQAVHIREKFKGDGRGRVVLTASKAMEYAWEGDDLSGEGKPSVFTSALVNGLQTGEADRDRDGHVSVDELYDYVYDHVRTTTPNQTPGKWTFDVEGDLYISRSPLPPVVEPAKLPPELQHAIESPLTGVREGAVRELERLFQGSHLGLAEASRLALELLAKDDSRRVSATATAILDTFKMQQVAADQRHKVMDQIEDRGSEEVSTPAESEVRSGERKPEGDSTPHRLPDMESAHAKEPAAAAAASPERKSEKSLRSATETAAGQGALEWRPDSMSVSKRRPEFGEAITPETKPRLQPPTPPGPLAEVTVTGQAGSRLSLISGVVGSVFLLIALALFVTNTIFDSFYGDSTADVASALKPLVAFLLAAVGVMRVRNALPRHAAFLTGLLIGTGIETTLFWGGLTMITFTSDYLSFVDHSSTIIGMLGGGFVLFSGVALHHQLRSSSMHDTDASRAHAAIRSWPQDRLLGLVGAALLLVGSSLPILTGELEFRLLSPDEWETLRLALPLLAASCGTGFLVLSKTRRLQPLLVAGALIAFGMLAFFELVFLGAVVFTDFVDLEDLGLGAYAGLLGGTLIFLGGLRLSRVAAGERRGKA